MLEVGSLVDGKYKILNKVGQGGMSVVYLAMNERANKQWAVKEVRKDGTLNFEAVKQGLIAETDILKKLKHPHLPSIADIIDTEDSFIIIMDYIQGNSLDKAIRDFGAQPEEAVIDWAKQLCDVLGYLHSLNPPIIYRDMKPANVMLQPNTSDKYPWGEISLIDFGTAREYKNFKAEDTKNLGTLDYAAPEQFGGNGQTDARTDIFALGKTIYHLVTGLSPRSPQTEYDMLPIRQLNPQLSSGLEKIIIKCTQQNRNDRYQSCAELLYDLDHYRDLEDEHIKQQKNKIKLFAASAALTLIFAIVSVFGLFSAEGAKKANYEYLLANADSVEKYYETILTDPTRTEAYLGTDDFDGLIDYLIADGALSAEDSAVLAKLKVGIEKSGSNGYNSTVDVLSQLKKDNPDGFEQVCYEIGETYLFYYNIGVAKDKYQTATSWLKDSVESYPVSKIYCDISNCLQNVYKYAKANQTAKLYEEYGNLWNEVVILYDETVNLEDDLKIQVWNEIVNMVNTNCKEFCEVTSQTEINSMMNRILSESSGVTNTFLKENVTELQANIETTLSKISTVESKT